MNQPAKFYCNPRLHSRQFSSFSNSTGGLVPRSSDPWSSALFTHHLCANPQILLHLTSQLNEIACAAHEVYCQSSLEKLLSFLNKDRLQSYLWSITLSQTFHNKHYNKDFSYFKIFYKQKPYKTHYSFKFRRRHKGWEFNLCVGKIPWRWKRQPTPLFLPWKFHGQKSLVGYSPRGRKESDMTEHIHTNISYCRRNLTKSH